MPAIDSDEALVAAQPPPSLTLYCCVLENDYHHATRGGRVLMKAVRGGAPEVLSDVAIMLMAKENDFLKDYAPDLEHKENTFFEVTIRRLPNGAADLPPDPEVVREIALTEKRLQALKAGAPA